MGLYTKPVQQLYVAYFNRPADPGGLQYWENVAAANGGDLSSISANFAKSDEYKATYGSKTSLDAVNTVYQNLFGRDADLPGLKAWAQALDNKWTTIDHIVTEIAGAAKDGANPGDAQDLTAYASKVDAAVAFTGALDTTPETLAYNGADANGAAVVALAKAFIAGVKDAATRDAAIATTALDATINSMVTAHSVVPPVTRELTAGIDAVGPNLGSNPSAMTGNDTINANNVNVGNAQTLSSFDSIDGGAGTDTLNVVSLGAAFDSTVISNLTVKNVENVNLTSDKGATINTTAWAGVTNLTVGDTGATVVAAAGTTAINVTNSGGASATTVNGGSTVTVNVSNSTGAGAAIQVGNTTGATGAVTVTSTTTATHVTAGAITVNGGITVTVNQNQAGGVGVGQDNTNGVVTVNGGASTTTATITNAAFAAGTASVAGVARAGVLIIDVNNTSKTAGTITTATVSNFDGLTIKDNALTSLTIAGGTNNVIIDNSGLTTPTNKTLALNINGQAGGNLDDADIYTTLNITTSGNSSTLSNITFGAMTGLNVAGSKGLTLNSTTGATALKAVAVSGTAGLTADLSTLVAGGSVNTSATTGTSAVTINANVATFTGGAGVDKVTLSTANASKAISLGAGDDTLVMGTWTSTAKMDGGTGTDTLSISAATAAAPGSNFATLVTGFERLTLTGATNQTVDLAGLGGFNYVSTSGGNGLILQNLPTGGTLSLTDAGTAYDLTNTAFNTPTNDTLNVLLTSGAAKAFGSITMPGVETVAITTVDTNTTPLKFQDTLSILDAAAKTITVGGSAGLTLTVNSLAITTLDASGVTAGNFTTVVGNLAAAAKITGTTSGLNDVDFQATTKGVTYVGGSGIDTLYVGTGADDVKLGGGTSDNFVDKGATGDHTITSTATGVIGAGTFGDVVNLGSGNNTVNLGDGDNTFTATSGKNIYIGGKGVDLVTLGAGSNTITTGAGADTVIITTAGANVNTYSTITDPHAGLSITLKDAGVETFNKTAVTFSGSNAVFQDYANAVIAAAPGNHTAQGAFGWFQFNGDTYLVESLHDTGAVGGTSFANGVDMIIKLTGLVDLSGVTFANTNTLTLA
jgi:S-layer protein